VSRVYPLTKVVDGSANPFVAEMDMEVGANLQNKQNKRQSPTRKKKKSSNKEAL